MKLIAILIGTLAAVCLTRVEGSAKSASAQPEVDPLVSADSSEVKKSPEAQRKRDTGYSYQRPGESSRPRLVETWTIRGRPSGKTSGHAQVQVARPFTRYGPPRQQTPQRTENHEVHVTLNAVGLALDEDRRQQRVPSVVRDNEFVGASPIASQNNVPFSPNSANYLPPRNQRLPVYTAPLRHGGFINQHGHRQASAEQQLQHHHHHHHQHQSTRINQALPVHQANSQISDGVNFLSQNSQAIEQLYEAPATNINYEPINEPLPDLPRDLQSLENAGSYQESQDFRLPGYASGVLDREALGNVKALEKDRLINELRQSLVEAQQPKNEFVPTGHNRENSAVQSERVGEHRGASCQGSFVPITSGYQYAPIAPASTATSGTSIVPPTTPQEPTGSQATTGHPVTSVSATTTTNNNYQFPNFAALLPVTSYLDYPAYGTNFLTSGTTGHVQSTSPTQFGIPIPQTNIPSAQKPVTSGTPSNPLPVSVQPLHPVLGTSANSLNPGTLQPSFPLVPAVGQTTLSHPVSPLLVKPVKPIYPLYYYPNVYQLQKPGLATVPWNYAPSYSPVRPDQAWK